MPSHAHQGSLRGVAARSGRLDQLVAEAFPVLSRARAAALIRSGSVQLDGQVASKPATRVVEGAVLVVDLPPPAPARAVPQDSVHLRDLVHYSSAGARLAAEVIADRLAARLTAVE